MKGVAIQAEFVDDMPRVTINGPILLGLPFSITVLCAANKFFVEGPPDPTISPVLSLETSFSSSPLSSIACCIAIKLKAAPSPINLSCLLSIKSSIFISGLP